MLIVVMGVVMMPEINMIIVMTAAGTGVTGEVKIQTGMMEMKMITAVTMIMMIKRTVTLMFGKTMGCLSLANRQHLSPMAKRLWAQNSALCSWPKSTSQSSTPPSLPPSLPQSSGPAGSADAIWNPLFIKEKVRGRSPSLHSLTFIEISFQSPHWHPPLASGHHQQPHPCPRILATTQVVCILLGGIATTLN